MPKRTYFIEAIIGSEGEQKNGYVEASNTIAAINAWKKKNPGTNKILACYDETPKKKEKKKKKKPKQVWYIESCCEEQSQVLHDLVLAKDADSAVEKWEKVRGSYATVSLVYTIPEAIDMLARQITLLNLKSLDTARVQREWRELKKTDGPEPDE